MQTNDVEIFNGDSSIVIESSTLGRSEMIRYRTKSQQTVGCYRAPHHPVARRGPCRLSQGLPRPYPRTRLDPAPRGDRLARFQTIFCFLVLKMFKHVLHFRIFFEKK